MKMKFGVDTTLFDKAMKDAEFTGKEKIEVLRAGGQTVKKRQKELVPVDTGDTKESIDIFEMAKGKHTAAIEVGPTTPYADVIEFGRANSDYPMQPFVRPSVIGREPVIQGQMTRRVNIIIRRKGLT